MTRFLQHYGTTWYHFQVAKTAAFWSTGHQQDPHFSAFHQTLNRALWSPLQASWHLLKRIIETFGLAGGSVDIVIDETLERRWGSKIPETSNIIAIAPSRVTSDR